MDQLADFFRKKKLEDDAMDLPKEQEWTLYFSGMLSKSQCNGMFERKLNTSKINSFLVSIFALTGTFISAYETESYLASNEKTVTLTRNIKGTKVSYDFINYTAATEDAVNLGLRLMVTLTTAIAVGLEIRGAYIKRDLQMMNDREHRMRTPT